MTRLHAVLLSVLLLCSSCKRVTVVQTWPTPEAYAMYHAGLNALLSEGYTCSQDSLSLICTTEGRSMGKDLMQNGGGEWELEMSFRYRVFQADDCSASWELLPDVFGTTMLVSRRRQDVHQFSITHQEYQRVLGKINLAVSRSRLTPRHPK